MISTAPSLTVIRDIYTKMLLARIIESHARKLYTWNYIQSVMSCRGHEAAQVGSAVCIEVGNDFTLPYYRDLGVVLTVGMTPYEVFRTYLQTHGHDSRTRSSDQHINTSLSTISSTQHWGYHKHNTITGPAPVATQLLHAAGIAFASKLRKASAVTIAYCGDEIVAEPDFLESLRFAAQHTLPALFICEQDCSHSRLDPSLVPSCTQKIELPAQLVHQRLDGTDVLAVYAATQAALQNAREGRGPTLLEMYITRQLPDLHIPSTKNEQKVIHAANVPFVPLQRGDPLTRCQRYLEEQDAWDEEWATQLVTRLEAEVERALQDALRDTLQLT
jgi:2-oxoisovalerate dehydrogenase E1 component alpha subunit